jgi:SAM-dependent methyltransferase
MSSDPTKQKCRVCGNSSLKLALDLGQLPLANSFLSLERAKDSTPEPRYPLRVFYCEGCGLIQLLDIVNRREMFDDYAFLTATSETSLTHFEQYADQMASRYSIKGGDLVVDIGSNDGTLLKAFKRHGPSVLGVEPARNVAKRAISEGIDTLADYFGPQTVNRIGPGRARLITANNVVSHVGDLNEFLYSVSRLLQPNGLFSFEVPWVVDVIRHYNFDIMYHEHLTYFGFKPLSLLLGKNDLELINVEYFPRIHGGTLRGVAAHPGAYREESSVVEKVFQSEAEEADFVSLERFANHVRDLRTKLGDLLRALRRDGKKIVGYGAPAKATILLNYCSIDRSMIDFVTDTTPLKQGKFIPGVRVPIVAPEEFRKSKPDYALLLAWNFKDEILNKEQEYMKSGGRFIVPFPEPSIVALSSDNLGSTVRI